jgi:hypothetical protein
VSVSHSGLVRFYPNPYELGGLKGFQSLVSQNIFQSVLISSNLYGLKITKQSLHYRNRVLCRVSKTLGKGYFTLGKCFAECNTRQRFQRQRVLCRVLFSDTRQRLYRVSKSTRQRKTLGKLRIEKIKKNSKTFFKF